MNTWASKFYYIGKKNEVLNIVVDENYLEKEGRKKKEQDWIIN